MTLDANSLLTRDTVATALTEAGFPISGATLATKATRGGGPPFRLFGRRPLYEWGAALAWAQGSAERTRNHIPWARRAGRVRHAPRNKKHGHAGGGPGSKFLLLGG